MGKKRSWLSLVKSFFIPETKSKAEKKSNKWRWIFGRLKLKEYPALAAPQRTVSEAIEEQRKHALAVAMATTAAAEAAVAAAHAAAEVVCLTSLSHEFKKRSLDLAATKIQAAYRGHLARKALKALKGLVRLQAIVRGQIVRRRLITKLMYFPSISKLQSRFQQLRVPILDEKCNRGEKKQISSPEDWELKGLKLECDSKRSWDDSLSLKEDVEALWLRKQEALSRRDGMKKFSFSYRERKNYLSLEETMTKEENGRQNHFDDIWADADTYKKRRDKGRLKLTAQSNLVADDTCGQHNLEVRSAGKQDSLEDWYSPILLPRRSFCCAKQKSIGDDNSSPNSPVFPSYMAATESSKAKARAMSTPKQRQGLFNTYSGHGLLSKHALSPWSSFNCDMASTQERASLLDRCV